jgi:hypothetical protein
MSKQKKAKRQTRPIISGYLERVTARIFDKFKREITDMIKGHQGVYALYRKDKLYYVGLASNLRNRINQHLHDRHHGKWTHFSLYIIRKTDHTKELESLLLRIAHPSGNAQRGKLRTTNNLLPKLKAQVKRKVKEELEDLFKRQRPAPKTRRVKTRSTASRTRGKRPLAGLFTNGKCIYVRYKGTDYKAWVYRNGTIRFNGQLYTNPSAAGAAVRGGKATNGWVFWNYKTADGELVKLSTLRRKD